MELITWWRRRRRTERKKSRGMRGSEEMTVEDPQCRDVEKAMREKSFSAADLQALTSPDGDLTEPNSPRGRHHQTSPTYLENGEELWFLI